MSHSVNIGQTPQGKTFEEWLGFEKYQTTIKEPFSRFLEEVYGEWCRTSGAYED